MEDVQTLYICEKPSQGRDLAKVLRCRQSGDGYLSDGNGVVVTWAIGHLLEQKMPGDYNSDDKRWNLDQLPLVPKAWEYKIKPSTSKQYKVVKQLIKRAQTTRISTDVDPEGEAIARELLNDAHFSGEIERVWIQGLDDVSIKRALANIRPGHASINLYYEALARARADYLVGINASRAFTLVAQKAGFTETLHIGRVITPTVALVCNRDQEIQNFKPLPFFTLDISVAVKDSTFHANWVAPDELSDDQGRCINKEYAEEVSIKCDGGSGVITDVVSKSGKQSAPLPFCLTSLQQYCSKRWGYPADEVLHACQSLYEKHKLITYPRTDSRYLPRSMFTEAQMVRDAIIQNLPEMEAATEHGDFTHQTPRCYKDEKVTAHHAIIPTSHVSGIIGDLKEKEPNIYEAVCLFYIAQFHSQFEFEETKVIIECKGGRFEAKGKVTLNAGWKNLFTNEDQYNPDDENAGNQHDDHLLPPIMKNDDVVLFTEDVEEKHTRPLPHYTDASLLSAMDNIHRFISEPELKKVVKEGGIGTPATRAAILTGAIDKGYLLRKKKKYFHASPKAYALIKLIPNVLASPGYTAIWEQQMKKIEAGQLDFNTFVNQIENWITKIVDQVKTTAINDMSSISKSLQESGSVHECFDCGSPMKRLQNKEKKSYFWACTDRDKCDQTFPDKNGVPYARPESPECPECGEIMFLRKGLKPGNKRKTAFWGCSKYPKCRGTLPVKKSKSTETI